MKLINIIKHIFRRIARLFVDPDFDRQMNERSDKGQP